ncbi:hypothetical protein SKAU_G00129910 [Synaphobranchus kaupii]|uniref:Nucleoside diphosphate kinase n=1 Tax=Synaphobranchus kaupii TaxID=118154 RepID=A0A9Q1J3C5_SYNKA|nr:hypothetical protein SKAU_G00129910 [Synaphobranchus kaupii]
MMLFQRCLRHLVIGQCGSKLCSVPVRTAAKINHYQNSNFGFSYYCTTSEVRERTLIAVKPDGVQRRLVGQIVQRFEKRGFKLVGLKMLKAPEDLLSQHYLNLQKKAFFPQVLCYMTSGPVVVMVWEGYNVVRSSRVMVGKTNPAEADPGTVRGDFGIHVSRNVVHASDSVEGAQREIQLWHNPGRTYTTFEDQSSLGISARMAEEQTKIFELPEDVETDDCMTTYTYIYSPDLLRDHVAFITGGGSGIGFRITEVLMRHGCDTVIASRNLERLTEAAKKLSDATGRRCLAQSMDVRQPETIFTAVEETLKEFGRIDILINNAAGNFLCPATSLSFNAFKTVMEIDTMGTFNTSKVVFEKWFKDHGGSIVNISATLGYKGQALQVHAGSAKAANDAMTKHLAVEWGPSGVRVNTLAPGPISGTEGFRRLGGMSAESSGAFQTIPLQRAGNKTEMAHGVLFLASRASSYPPPNLLNSESPVSHPSQITGHLH